MLYTVSSAHHHTKCSKNKNKSKTQQLQHLSIDRTHNRSNVLCKPCNNSCMTPCCNTKLKRRKQPRKPALRVDGKRRFRLELPNPRTLLHQFRKSDKKRAQMTKIGRAHV